VDGYLIADEINQFIKSHPQLTGYMALMLSLMFTGRARLVLLGGVLGLVVIYAYRVGSACAAGHLPAYHGLIALLISATAIVVAAKYAFR